MKPIKLIMSAFGSYGGIEEIDFEKVNQGIFLITGDTGAGKTTVFDAITYALFDETSGGRREGDMMRSQFAEESTPTYVELTFSYNGNSYRIRRNPNYQRISKRKNKNGEYTYTTELASVELTMPDGQVFPGKARETNEKIREILGVDVNQFTQISMIAQGEFLKLLHAPSRERKEIFSHIFDTRIYWQIQNRLKEQAKGIFVELEHNKLLLERELQGIRCEREEWQQALTRIETGKEEIFRVLSLLEEEQILQKQQLLEQEEQISSEVQQIKLQLAQAEECNLQFQRKQEETKAIGDMEQQLQELYVKMEQEEVRKKELEHSVAQQLPELEQKLARARNQLPEYERLAEHKKELKQLEQKREQAHKQWKRTEEEWNRAKEEVGALQSNQKELQPQLEELSKQEQQQREEKSRKEEISSMRTKYKEAMTWQQELVQQRQLVAEAIRNSEQKSHAYETCYHMFVAEQAGILAEGLIEGEACPVCGSSHHPMKAVLSEHAVTQQQVEQAKQSQKQAQQLLEHENEKLRSQQERLEGLKQVLLHSGQQLQLGMQEVLYGGQQLQSEMQEKTSLNMQGEEFFVKLEELLKCAETVNRERLNRLQKAVQQLYEKQKQFQMQEQRLEQLMQQQEILSSQREKLREQAYESNLAYEKRKQSIQETQQKMEYASIEALKVNIEKVEQQKKQLSGQLEQVSALLQQKQQQAAHIQGKLEERKKQLELLTEMLNGKEPVDISILLEREKGLLQKKEGTEHNIRSLLGVMENNQLGKEKLVRLYEQREEFKKQYEVADTLSKTANGNLRQQARLDLQTYVQRRYFKYMIGEANRRLVEMSNGKFILQCRQLEQLAKQGEAGLDLDVYDMVTDKVRDVKTLSGGESFLAALSMALGMADVIQKNAGRVHLDTMFIDEGFGSLDEEARGKALQILQELAGEKRLIGIISHVTEMKEQMDRKLIISKSDKGSHAKWQIED